MVSKNIGKVTFNLIEDKEPSFSKEEKELLRVVRDCAKVEYSRVVEDNNCYFYLENLSKLRGNIVKWLPILPTDYVLEVGAGTGTVNEELTKLSDNIFAIEQNLTFATILATRIENCKNANVYACGYDDAISDICARNQTFEWIIIYDISLLERVKKLLSSNGRIVIIIDNRMGMKFLSGNKYSDGYFTGVEGKGKSGITLNALNDSISKAGFNTSQIYYPYPDWKFTKNLYSDKRLPLEGELVNNLNNFDSDRMLLFSEKDAFDASIRDGSFPVYSNSYLAIIGEPLAIDYVRFSDDRSDEHSIFTTIETKEDGHKTVRKYPASKEAYGHILNIRDYYSKLSKRYLGSGLNINSCVIINESTSPIASFEYVDGVQLSTLMDECLLNNDLEGFYKLFDKYVKYIGYNDGESIADLDVVFSNILVNGESWTLIDYEWCKESSIPVKETAYRAVYCYILEDNKRETINLDLIRQKLELSKAASDLIESDEAIFQKKVTGRNKSLEELRESFGFKAINPIPLAEKIYSGNSVYNFKVYPADSTGNFTEDLAYAIKDAYKSDSEVDAMVAVEKNELRLRIDPIDSSCIVTIKECRINELDFPIENKKRLVTNGKRFGTNVFVFDHSDPNLVFELDGLIREDNSFFTIKLDVVVLKQEVAAALSAKQGLFK